MWNGVKLCKMWGKFMWNVVWNYVKCGVKLCEIWCEIMWNVVWNCEMWGKIM